MYMTVMSAKRHTPHVLGRYRQEKKMKNIILIQLIALLILVSCSTTKSKVESNEYVNCLPTAFRKDISLLVKSFNEFVIRNHNGQIENFISSIVNREFPEQADFNSLDSQLASKLRANNFKEFIYTEYEEKLSDSGFEIAPPRTAGQDEEPKRMMIKVDLDKPYLKCLNSTPTKGTLVKEYVKLQIENPSISPLVVGDLFLKNKSDVDYGTELSNTIIAVELYYMILNEATK